MDYERVDCLRREGGKVSDNGPCSFFNRNIRILIDCTSTFVYSKKISREIHFDQCLSYIYIYITLAMWDHWDAISESRGRRMTLIIILVLRVRVRVRLIANLTWLCTESSQYYFYFLVNIFIKASALPSYFTIILTDLSPPWFEVICK